MLSSVANTTDVPKYEQPAAATLGSHRPGAGDGRRARRDPARRAALGALGTLSAITLSFAFAHLASASSQPTVTGVSPSGGPLAGGNVVTVTGSGLTGALLVQFGETPGTNVTVAPNGDSLAVTAPPAVSGTVDVTVTTTGGTSATSAADKYGYYAPPVATSVSPTAGPAAGGNTVTVSGANLSGATAVDFGSVPGTSVSVNSGGSSLTVVAPAAAPGTVDVTVTTPGGTTPATSEVEYTFVPAPIVTGVSPVAGLPSGGTSVTVTGSNLTGASAVDFGSTPGTGVSANSGGTSLTVTTPAESAGTVNVTITTTGGTSATSAADDYTYETAPTVTAVSPSSGPTGGGTRLTITGTNLIGTSAVKFGTVSGTNISVGSGTSLTVTAPAGAAGTTNVAVTTPLGTSPTSSADDYTYVPPPTVTGVTPNQGPLNGGGTVTVSGTNLTGAISVTFGTAAATNVVVASGGDTLTANPPAGSAGTVDVTVTTVGGTSSTSSVDDYTYVPAPTVTALSPNQGSVNGGTTITVSGTNLTGATSVEFGTTAATNVVVASGGASLTATAPAESAGQVDVTVTTVGGTSVTSSADDYTFVAVPTVTGVSPNQGSQSGGGTATVTGSNLTGASSVNFGSIAASNITVNSGGTSLTVTVPSESAGTVDVTVTTVGGTSATSSADDYTYDPPPSVSAVNPESDLTSGGGEVQITGSNFSGASAVNFGTTPGTIISTTATAIDVTAPPHVAGTVDVTVVGPYGTSATSSADQFHFVNSPTSSLATTVTMNPGALSTLAGSGSASTDVDGTGSAASFSGPSGMTLLNGKLYVIDAKGLRQVDPSTGAVTTVFSYSHGCHYVDSQNPASVSICNPGSLTTDGYALYFLDSGNLRLVDPTTGAVTTLCATYNLTGLAYGNDGNLYVTDGSAIYQVNLSTDTLTTVVTSPANMSLGQLAPGTTGMWVRASYANSPYASALYELPYGSTTLSSVTSLGDGWGGLVQTGQYVYAVGDNGGAILRYDTTNGGTPIIVAGNAGANGYKTTDDGYADGTGYHAWISTPSVLLSDGSGSIYIIDNSRVRTMVAAAPLATTPPPNLSATLSISPGAISTFAGSGPSNSDTNGTGTAASFDDPAGMTWFNGELYVIDATGLRQVDPSTGAVTTVFVYSHGCSYPDGQNPADVSICNPGALTTDGSALYFLDTGNLRRIDPVTGAVTTLLANLNFTGLAYGNDGNLYVTDSSGISEVNLSTDALTTVVTAPANMSLGQLAPGTTGLWVRAIYPNPPYASALYELPYGSTTLSSVTSLGDGWGGLVQTGQYLYAVGDNGGAILRYDTTNGGTPIIVAGNAGANGYKTIDDGYADGTGYHAWISIPSVLLSDGSGTIYMIDNSRVRTMVAATPLSTTPPPNLSATLSISPGAISTFAGSGPSNSDTNGTGTAASFDDPAGMTWFNGKLYVIDYFGLRQVDPSTGAVTTVFPYSHGCSYPDGQNPADVTICLPGSLTTDGSALYFLDYGNLRRIDPVTGAVTTLFATYNLVGLAYGNDGNLYVTDGSAIYQVNLSTDTLTTVVTSPANMSLGQLAPGTTGLWVRASYPNSPYASALYELPYGSTTLSSVTSLGDGWGGLVQTGQYLYAVGDNGGSILRYDTTNGGTPIIVAGGSKDQNGNYLTGYIDGNGFGAEVASPSVLLSDGSGTIYMIDNSRVRAMDQGQLSPIAAGGPLLSYETRGGSNPSELGYCQQCAGDPIDTATGYFTEQSTDAKVPGRGMALDLTRSYDSQASGVLGRFGYGWADSYSMSISADPYTASTVDVTQENGSVVQFQQNANGTWSAASRVLATLTKNADGSWTFTRKKKQVFGFDSTGKLVSERDLNGETTTLSYNSSSQLTTVTDQAGRTLSFTYSGALVTSMTDPMGNVTHYGYDSSDELTSVTDPTGAVSEYGYGSDHELTTVTDPRGGVTNNTYDASRRVTTQIDPMGRTTTFSYSLDSTDTGTVTMTDPTGAVTTYQYSGGELLTKTVASGTSVARTWSYSYDPVTLAPTSVTAPGNRTTTSTYDADGNLLTQTDPLGRKTTNTYDALDDLASSTDPAGVTTTYTYDSAGNLLSVSTPLSGTSQTRVTSYTHGNTSHSGDVTAVTDANGHTTSYSYDFYGDQSAVANPLGHATSMTYDADGHLLTTTDALGKVTTRTYDKRGELLSVQDPDGNVTSYTYDADGNKASVTDANGHMTTYTYDADNDLTATTDANGHATTATFDGDGRPLTATDPNGHTMTNTYDAAGDLVTTKVATGAVTTNSYDGAGDKVSSTDANGNTTSYAYDADGELTSQTDPSGGTTGYSYDGDGRKTSSTDPNGHTTSYVYDSLGRLTSSTDPNGHTTSYTYDLVGNELTLTDSANRVTTQSYDAANELTAVSYSDDITPNASYTYDADGRRTTMTDGTGTTSYSYDAAGRPLSVTNGAGKVVGYGFDAAGNVTSITYPNGQKATYGYDPTNQLTSVSDWLGNTVSYGHDSAGNVTSITYPNGITTAVTVDAANAATSIVATSGSSSVASFSYTRDAAEQITAETDNAASQPTQSYTYTAAERVASANGQGYSYDSAGQLTARPGGTTLSYNAGGELTTETTGSATANFTYDSLGDRTSAVPASGPTSSFGYGQSGELISSTTPQASATYAYNGDGLRMSDSFTGSVSASNQFTWDSLPSVPHLLADGTNAYVYGVGDTPVEQINLSTGTPTYFITDALGSVRALTNSSGTVVGTESFDAYGNAVSNSGTVTTPFGFAGAYTDPTGLEYLVNRYYDPATGQFLSVDPLVNATSQPYTYAGGDPVNGSDPLGLFCWSFHCLANDAIHVVHTASSVVSAAAGACALIAGVSIIGNAGVSEACGAVSLAAAGVQAVSGAALYATGQESGTNAILDAATFGAGAAGKALIAGGQEALEGAAAYRAAAASTFWPISSALNGLGLFSEWTAGALRDASYLVNVPNVIWGFISAGMQTYDYTHQLGGPCAA